MVADPMPISEAMVSGLNMPVLLLSKEEKILLANSAFERFSGISALICCGETFSQIVALSDQQTADEMIQMSRSVSGNLPMRLNLRSQVTFYATISYFESEGKGYYLLQGDQNRADRYMNLNLQLAKTQEALAEARNQAKRHDQTRRRLDEFLAVLMHDIRSPLSTLMSSMELILEDLEDGNLESMREMLCHGKDSAQRLFRFADKLYQNVSVENAKANIEPLEMNEIFDELRLDLKAQFEEAGARMVVMSGFPIIWGDRHLIRQLLQNLILNAIKFREPSRPLEIELTYKRSSGKTVEIAVSDNGGGLPEEDAQKLFDRYHKSEGPNDGMGVGLATCKLIVEKHGWKIQAAPNSKGGASFIIRMDD